MPTPLSSRPTISQEVLRVGYVDRYFVQNVSTQRITEVDNTQYNQFKSNPLYFVLKIRWVISGFDENILAKDGNIVYGTKQQNQVSLDFAEKKMSGILKHIRNPLEYFNGTKVSETKLIIAP